MLQKLVKIIINNNNNNNNNNNKFVIIIIIIIIIRLRSFCYSIAESNLGLHLSLRTIQNGKMWKAIKREQELGNGERGNGRRERDAENLESSLKRGKPDA